MTRREDMSENNPFARLPEVHSFAVTSSSLADGGALPEPQLSGIFGVPGGQDISPQLAWSGAPEGTKGYAVTMYDPDAPTGSGFWHWAVANIPADATSLDEGAGDEGGSGIPAPAFQLPNDARASRYIGGAPAPGDAPHRYYLVVSALDTGDLGIPQDATPAYLGFAMAGHIVGRAVLQVTASQPAAPVAAAAGERR
jgi:Raf kinase inhibitor-like YbhB/YbcL family protein